MGAAVVAVVAAVAAVAGGCWGANERCEEEPATAAQLDTKAPTPDGRDQYELAHQLQQVRSEPGDKLSSALERIRQDWQGERYTWDVGIVPILCRSADRCMVAGIDHNRPTPSPVVVGWMPQLKLEEATFEDLTRRCAGRKQCVVRFSGELDVFVLSLEEPTRLEFDSVELEDVRAATAAESWIRRPAATALAAQVRPAARDSARTTDPNLGGARTSIEATEADLQ